MEKNYNEKSVLFYKVIWKNFKYNWRDYILLVICESLVTALSFAGIASYYLMNSLHSTSITIFDEGLGELFIYAARPFLVCGLVLIILVVIAYLNKRVPSYILLQRMGIKKKDFKKMIFLEASFSYICSLVIGMVAGRIIVLIFEKWICRNDYTIHFKHIPVWLYLGICGITLLVYLLGILLTNELQRDFKVINAMKETERIEKLPGKRAWIGCVIGIICILNSIYQYRKLYNFENIYLIIVFFLGVYLVVRNAGAIILRRFKKKKGYFKHLLDINGFYYRSKTASMYVFLFSTLLTCVYLCFFVRFISVQIAEKPETLFPYDFMCIADENDEKLWEELQEKYHAEIMKYSMVRVSNADKTERVESGHETRIQGQQIGISESTYHKLKSIVDCNYKEKNLGLDAEGNKIYIVHQQDVSVKAQPVDWFFRKKKPDIHIGVPCRLYDWANKNSTFSEKIVVGEEIGSLTGAFRQGNLENLIVFSDVYFEKTKELWKTIDACTALPFKDAKEVYPELVFKMQGPTTLVLINVDKKYVLEIDEQLEKAEKNREYWMNYDSKVKFHYSKFQAINDMKTERTLNSIMTLFLIFIFLVLICVFMIVKVMTEMEERKSRNAFLRCIGMSSKKRKKLFRKEMGFYYWFPTMISLLATTVFTAATIHVRLYDELQRGIYLKWLVPMIMVCVVAQGVFEYILIQIVIRKVGAHRD